jgi:hypothetical protein
MSPPAIVSPSVAYSIVHSLGFTLDKLKQIKVSENFTWAEVFHNRTLLDVKSARIEIYKNALATAGRLEAIRRFLRELTGRALVIHITSWYRSPAANAAAGGVNRSQHMLGLAADFVVPGYQGVRGNQYIQAHLIGLKDTVKFCLEITNGQWCHIDCRPSNIVFENKGGGQYPVLTLAQRNAFIHKYGKAA